jgi:hypothetical protein
LPLIVQGSCCCQTCKLLNALSRTRDIWINQHHQYVEHGMRSARLEEPLDSYSAPELERWVLMRRSADVGWRCEHTKFSRNRWVSQANVAGTCLVPGGRWLLVGGEDGGVTTYDLDSPTMMGRSLIMRNDQDEPQPIHRIAIDIDLPKQSPNLTFTMALSPAVQFSKPCRTYH